MLVLNRRRGEKLVIRSPAGDITLVVLEVHGPQVRLGVEAPRSVPVHREEVWRAIRQAEGGGGHNHDGG